MTEVLSRVISQSFYKSLYYLFAGLINHLEIMYTLPICLKD
jgi:hypothetical protein